jgi:hypothetical protein
VLLHPKSHVRGPRGFRTELVWAKRAVSDIDSTRLATAIRTTDCVDVCAWYRLEKARTVFARLVHANPPNLLDGQASSAFCRREA